MTKKQVKEIEIMHDSFQDHLDKKINKLDLIFRKIFKKYK